MATYASIREQVVQGVIRGSLANPIPLDRIRAQFDAGIFSINSQTSQVYAGKENNREMLRTSTDLTFVSGDSTLPTNTLKGYMEDCTFSVSGSTVKYSFRRYPDWLRGGDPRLGLWTTIGEAIKAKTPTPVTAVTGTGVFSYIGSPEIPATEDDEFVAPEDYLPDLIAAMIQYILGQSMQEASATA